MYIKREDALQLLANKYDRFEIMKDMKALPGIAITFSHWELLDKIRCANCKEEGKLSFSFCPRCGARMR